MKQTVDLHMHSYYSDGSDSLNELLENIAKSGITTFSLTDHDTIGGCIDIADTVPDNMRFIYGVEFSCRNDIGKCHILGYDYQPDNKELSDVLDAGRELRRQKLQKRLDYLINTFDVQFSEEELAGLYTMNSVGKPHIAKLLVKKGIAENISEGIKKYINGCKTGSDRISAKSAIHAIRQAGGIPVWAHPLGGEGERHLTEEEFGAQLDCLIADGILGLECYYSRYTDSEKEFLVSQAKKHNLLISGGSDYHGTNKNIPLGTLGAETSTVSEEHLTVLDRLSYKTF